MARSSISIDLETPKSLVELLCELVMVETGSTGPGHDRKIHSGGENRAVNPEKLSNPAFQAVATDGIADLAAYCNA
jgi:hypothetical protein